MATGICQGPMVVNADVPVEPGVRNMNLFSNTFRSVSLQIVPATSTSTGVMDRVTTDFVAVEKGPSPVSLAKFNPPVTGGQIKCSAKSGRFKIRHRLIKPAVH